jgi:hypothetical protein
LRSNILATITRRDIGAADVAAVDTLKMTSHDHDRIAVHVDTEHPSIEKGKRATTPVRVRYVAQDEEAPPEGDDGPACSLCGCGRFSHYLLCTYIGGWDDCWTHPGTNCDLVSEAD